MKQKAYEIFLSGPLEGAMFCIENIYLYSRPVSKVELGTCPPSRALSGRRSGETTLKMPLNLK